LVSYGLYVWHDDSGTPQLDYITSSPGGNDQSLNAIDRPYNGADGGPAARVTPDGRHLLFTSTSGLSGFDQSSSCPNRAYGFNDLVGCSQLYVYSLDGSGPNRQHLQCASCSPSGIPASDDSVINVHTSAPEGGIAGLDAHFSHAISNDGRFVFFSSGEPLVAQDTNGKFDAYEFETETGEVHLLSSGTEERNSFFLDASADGSDAFIATTQPLLGWDHDRALDLYDVRMGGGFPEPPPAPEACEGETCKGTATEPPTSSGPGSAFANGPGSPSRRCRPGLVKRHGRCVKLRKHHSKRSKRANANRRAGR
jgi:WD40-like Beta Propeller Repeat